MKNTSKKLFVSVFALLFAIVAVATTSFAWFTISNKARIDQFELNITTGTGMEIQVTTVGDTVTSEGWKNVITTTDLQTILGYQSLRLDHLTSTDGINFKTIDWVVNENNPDGIYGEVDAGSNLKMLAFDVHFRSNEALKVYLQEITKVTSTLATIEAKYDTSKVFNVYPTNAVRVSFQVGSDAIIWEPVQESTGEGETPAIVNRPYLYQNANTTTDQAADGAIEFFNRTMMSINGVTEYTNYLDIPEGQTQSTVLADDIYNQILLTLTENTDASPYAYYGKVTVRIWLEGWDGDCFNVLFNSKFNTVLAFEGTLE